MKFLKTLVCAVGFLATDAVATKKLKVDKFEKEIKTHGLKHNLKDLEKIARKNGDNRAFGLPGYKASLDYVLKKLPKHKFDVKVQPFNHLFEETREIKVTGPDGEDVYVITLLYNTGTPVPDGITADLIDVPVDDTVGSGCEPAQWEGIDATGKIALVKRGVCPLSQKLINAREAGALAAILYHNEPGEEIPSATLGAENLELIVPTGMIPLEVGTSWSERLADGETLEVNLLVDAIAEERKTWNIIAETKVGDPKNVVMLGAHLDSVQAGPGINDDGSGTSALLEMAEAISKYKKFKNKVRFAWWGAEEAGLVGSLYYGSQLSEKEADAIRFYFNYDMIGSPDPFFAVYADNEAHEVGGKILLDYLTSKGADASFEPFGTSSDYVAFLELGIPSSGLFTGAGAPNDVCYHQACDDIDNINWDAYTLNAKAAARALATFALDMSDVPPRDKTSLNPKSRRGVATSLRKWTDAARKAEKSHTCGDAHDVVV